MRKKKRVKPSTMEYWIALEPASSGGPRRERSGVDAGATSGRAVHQVGDLVDDRLDHALPQRVGEGDEQDAEQDGHRDGDGLLARLVPAGPPHQPSGRSEEGG